MVRAALVYSETYLKHFTGSMHVENSSRLKIAVNALESFGLIEENKFMVLEPRMADASEIEAVHSSRYVEEVRKFCGSGGGYYDGDTYLSKESYDVALLAAGGCLKACEEVFSGRFKRAFALIRPPGHHAGVDGAALGAATNGFCVFNNVAVMASYALSRKLAKRVMILDFDVHHGNGTQEIFDASPDVLYVSLHQRGIYPGTGFEYDVGSGEGKGYTVNIPLPSRCDDEIYLKVLSEIVKPVAEQFKPELMLISAGYDPHHTDLIGGMLLSSQGFSRMVSFAVEIAERYGRGRVIGCLEGGYSAEALSKGLPASLAALIGEKLEVSDEAARSQDRAKNIANELIKSLKEILGEYWSF
jgi:acetoin utilization deacetylase AcuC-like enzyme